MKINSGKKSIWPLIISVAVVLIMVSFFFWNENFNREIREGYDILTSDDTERINAWVQNFGVWGPLILILAMIVQLILMFIPSVLVMVIAVLAYGPFWGALIAMVGVIVSATVGYLIGDYFGDFTVERLIGKPLAAKIEAFVKDYGLWTIIVVRFSPFLSHDLVSLIGGVVEMRYRRFIAATIIGSIPLIALVAFFGQSIDSLKPGLIVGSVISIVVFAAYFFLDKKKKRN